MTDLNELLERVKKVQGPDRELDAAIATAIGGYVYEKRGRDQKAWFYPVDGRSGRRQIHGAYDALARYTASIDAALGLVERLLPGWMWTIYHEYVITEKPNVVFLKHKNIDLPLEIGEARGDHEAVPLAILAALLSALISKGNQS